MLDRTLAPPVLPLEDFKPVRPKTHSLSGGSVLHTLGAGLQAVLSLSLIFPLPASESFNIGDISLTASMLAEGTSQKNASEIAECFASVGAFTEINTDFDRAVLNVYVTSKHLPSVCELLAEMLNEPAFPEVELEKLRSISLQKLKVDSEKTNYAAAQVFRQTLFGAGSPYGYRKTEELIRRTDVNRLKEVYEAVFARRPFTAVLAGQVAENEINTVIDVFGNFTRKPTISSPKTKFSVLDNLPDSAVIIEKEKAVQTSLRIGRSLFTKNDPDYTDFSVLNEILGGYFGSRLMQNIREKHGFTYGINSVSVCLQNAGYWFVGTDVKKESAGQAVEEIYREIELLRSGFVPDLELETVKSYMAGSFISSVNTPFSLADLYRSVWFDGLTEDYYDTIVSRIRAVTPERLHDLAQKYWSGPMLEVRTG